jgi:hypothetical protein
MLHLFALLLCRAIVFMLVYHLDQCPELSLAMYLLYGFVLV